MGQYYVAVILDEDGGPTHVTRSWDFNSGAKLMEHSWLQNRYVAAVETLLVAEAPRRVVWAGDYADPEPDASNLYDLTDGLEPYRPDVTGLGQRSAWRKETHVTEIDPEITANAWPVIVPRLESHPFLVNWDKRQYVDKRTVPAGGDGWRIHPLPLLTVEGNGRGGGDFDGDGEVIGSWARDHISLSSHAPEGFAELVFDLVE
jgi:hypothetical protein